KRGRDRRGLLEVNVNRLRSYRSGEPDTDVFGESACSDTEDFIARLELGHVPADRFNRSREVRSRSCVFRLTKAKDKSADTALQHATVEKSEGNRANPNENLVVVRNRLFDLLSFQNVISRTVCAILNRFHPLSAGGHDAAGVVR